MACKGWALYFKHHKRKKKGAQTDERVQLYTLN